MKTDRPHSLSVGSSRSGSRTNLVGYLASASSGPGSGSGGEGEDEDSTASEDGGADEKGARAPLLSRPRGVWKGLTSLTTPSSTPEVVTPVSEVDQPFPEEGLMLRQPSKGKGRQVLVEKRGHHYVHPNVAPIDSAHRPIHDEVASSEQSRALFPSLAAAVASARASAAAAYASRADRDPRDRARVDDDGSRLSGEIVRSKGRHSPLKPREVKHRTASPLADEGALAEPPAPTSVIEAPTPSPALFSFLIPHGRKAPISFRRTLVPEVLLLISALALGIYRIAIAAPEPGLGGTYRTLPIPQLLVLLVAIPIVALFRRQRGSYLVPFTDERGYRDLTTDDDGFAGAIALPLLLSCAVVYDAGLSVKSWAGVGGDRVGLTGLRGIAEVWDAKSLGLVRSSGALANFVSRFVIAAKSQQAVTLSSAGSGGAPVAAVYAQEQARTLYTARVDLLCFTILNAYGLLLDIALARIALRISWLPRSNTKRFFGATAKAAVVGALFALAIRQGWAGPGLGPQDISSLEAGASIYISQTSIYSVTRLARRGFTLGEVSVFAAASMSLLLEFSRLSLARWKYPSLVKPTVELGFLVPPLFRVATPVIAFQHALIPGVFTIGFLLAPLLLSSRALAQQPLRRRKGQVGTDVLRGKREKERMRKGLAFSVYGGIVFIILALLGGWTGWILGGGWTEAWEWALRFTFFGGDGVEGMTRDTARPRRWIRVGLLLYWIACLSSAVGGWTTHIVRKRRLRVATTAPAAGATVGQTVNGKSSTVAPPGSKVNVEVMREEKRMRADLNWRRKFFHGLAVIMFVPAITVDPAFTSLAFSVAFSVFTFAEYARYFALFPIGAPIHVFFSEFVDNKDSGPVILSHFYLLTGCAGGLWLEGKGIKQMTGVLALGVGDSMASIVGKRFGRIRWPQSSKTVEGTVAFVISMILSAVSLRIVSAVPPFPIGRYTLAISLSALLEAFTNQNDNLVIPLYNWALLSLLNV